MIQARSEFPWEAWIKRRTTNLKGISSSTQRPRGSRSRTVCHSTGHGRALMPKFAKRATKPNLKLQPTRLSMSVGRHGDAGMIRGGCLCGSVRFEIKRAVGPFELCHCSRCRKTTGSAFAAGLGVEVADFRLLSGAELVRTCEAPVREHPPAYRVAFCSRCGSPVPDPRPGTSWFEIPAGLLDDAPELKPDKHIFVDCKSPWFDITDQLPQLTKAQVAELRRPEKGAC